MAAGDVLFFNEFGLELGKETHQLVSDTFKLAIVDDTITPAVDDTTPTYSDYSANEVSGTNYPAGGITITSQTWTLVSGVPTFDFANITIAQSGSGFSDGYWGILYNTSSGSGEAVLFIDLGGPVGNVSEPLYINVHPTAMFQLKKAASVAA